MNRSPAQSLVGVRVRVRNRVAVGVLTACPHGTLTYIPPEGFCRGEVDCGGRQGGCPRVHPSREGLASLALCHHQATMRTVDPSCRCAAWTFVRWGPPHVAYVEVDGMGRTFERNCPVPPRLPPTQMYRQRIGMDPAHPRAVFWSHRDWTPDERALSRRGARR